MNDEGATAQRRSAPLPTSRLNFDLNSCRLGEAATPAPVSPPQLSPPQSREAPRRLSTTAITNASQYMPLGTVSAKAVAATSSMMRVILCMSSFASYDCSSSSSAVSGTNAAWRRVRRAVVSSAPATASAASLTAFNLWSSTGLRQKRYQVR